MGEGPQQGTRQGTDRRGTFWDWPVGVIVAGVALWLFVALGRGTPTVVVYVVIAFGVVSLLIRRGAFSPRPPRD